MNFDITKIAQGTAAARNAKMVRYEWDDWSPPKLDDIDLEELAQGLNKSPLRTETDSTKTPLTRLWVTVYVDGTDFFDLQWASFTIIDVNKLRQNIKISKWDKFVWDKHLVKGVGEISNVDKIWQMEEIYDVDKEYVNDIEIDKFRRYFNPLTYQKCEWNISSDS